MFSAVAEAVAAVPSPAELSTEHVIILLLLLSGLLFISTVHQGRDLAAHARIPVPWQQQQQLHGHMPPQQQQQQQCSNQTEKPRNGLKTPRLHFWCCCAEQFLACSTQK
ncbi:unnamed protein product [Pleuronectes platessa]|uniref:Uncharacterized protein n=1 Tax=Pleuronectes platessa TaxID=8262 RepID=A0A9N7W0Y2_PLEPL|nr:unnamed protein product [Pleuronectes platessa]